MTGSDYTVEQKVGVVPDQLHWRSEKEVCWIQKPRRSSKTLPSKVIP